MWICVFISMYSCSVIYLLIVINIIVVVVYRSEWCYCKEKHCREFHTVKVINMLDSCSSKGRVQARGHNAFQIIHIHTTVINSGRGHTTQYHTHCGLGLRLQSWLMPQSPHRLRNDLKCVEWDVKPCSIQSNQARLPGSPVAGWTDTIVPWFRHSAHCWYWPPSASMCISENMCCSTHTQQLRRQKLFCCRPSGMQRIAITSAAGHELQTFQACTERTYV